MAFYHDRAIRLLEGLDLAGLKNRLLDHVRSGRREPGLSALPSEEVMVLTQETYNVICHLDDIRDALLLDIEPDSSTMQKIVDEAVAHLTEERGTEGYPRNGERTEVCLNIDGWETCNYTCSVSFSVPKELVVGEDGNGYHLDQDLIAEIESRRNGVLLGEQVASDVQDTEEIEVSYEVLSAGSGRGQVG